MTLHVATYTDRAAAGWTPAMAASLREHHPDLELHVLDLDGDGSGGAGADVALEELGLPAAEVRRRAAAASPGSLAASFRPAFLLALLERLATPVLWLDPGWLAYGPLTALRERLEQDALVLLSRVAAPGARADELAVLKEGTARAAALGVAPGAEPFLRWWDARCRFGAAGPPARRWLDLAPSAFDATVLSEPGAVGTLADAARLGVASTPSGFMVGGVPLRLIGVGGTLADPPPASGAGWTALLADVTARWPPPAALAPSPWDHTASGLALDAVARRRFAERWGVANRAGDPPPPDPYEHEEAFVALLAEPADRRRGAALVPGYLAMLRESDPALAATTPDLLGAGGAALVAWAAEHRPELPAAWRTAASSPAGPPEGPWELQPGVTLVAAPEAAAETAVLLEQAGVEHHVVTWSRADRARTDPQRAELAVHDVNLIAVEPDDLADFEYDIGVAFRPWRYTIALWDERPSAATGPALTRVDEVWVRGAALAAELAEWTFKPVHPIGRAVRAAAPIPLDAFRDGATPLLSTPLQDAAALTAVLVATAAPRRDGRLGLVVVAGAAEERLELLEHAWFLAHAGEPGLLVVESEHAEQLAGLLAGADAIVAHTASGPFAAALERAVAAGTPVIAPAELVGPPGSDAVSVPTGDGSLADGVAAWLADRAGAAERGAAAGARLAAASTEAAVAARVAARLADLSADGKVPVGPRGVPEPRPAVA